MTDVKSSEDSAPPGTTSRLVRVDPSQARLPGKPGETPLARRVFLASVVAAVLPIGVAAVLAIHRGWVPIGDNAFFAIRARDVLSGHPPLLGTWTSAASHAKTQFNNPGPLLFDALAVPTRLFDSGAGLALGTALLNALATIGVAVVAYRRGGPLLGSAAMAVAAALAWAMGSEVLFDPTQPSSLLLPFLFFVMLVWSICCGDLAALPWAAGVGSLIVQSYLTYVYLVAMLAAWAVVGLGLQLRATRRDDPDSWPALRRRALRTGAIASVVFAACWVQPLIEQFTSHGAGNLTRLVRSIGDPALKPIGYGLGTRLVAEVVTLPPWWLRPSFKNYLASHGSQVPVLSTAIVSLAVLAAVLAWCVWDARRRRDRATGHAIATAIVALIAGLVTAGRIPLGAFGVPTAHEFRWLWPLAAFVSFAVATTLARRLGQRLVRSTLLVVAFALATVALAALNLRTTDQGASAGESQIPVVSDLGRQMGRLDGKGPLLVNFRGVKLGDPYGTAILAQLQRRGVAFVTDDTGLLYQLGPARRFNGHNARARLLLREGDAARDTPPGAQRIALHHGLTAREQVELAALNERIADYIRQHGLRLNRRGLKAVRSGQLTSLPQPPSGLGVDPEALFTSRDLVAMVQRDFLVLKDGWERRFQRYATLQNRWDNETVALFVAPIGSQSTLLNPQS